MFKNLIESSSHVREMRRRSSFVLFTTATYLVIFVVAGVVSIYAYDAKLEEQAMQLSVDFVIPQEEKSDSPPAAPGTHAAGNHQGAITQPADAMLSVNHPEKMPDVVSATANKNPELPGSGKPIFIGENVAVGPGGGSGNTPGGGRKVVQATPILTPTEEPPPAESPKVVQKVLNRTVINGLAISLPKPDYPPIAKRMGIQGSVSIQVLVDEKGKVISAKTLSGSPFLTGEALKAAVQARFLPAKIGDQPVKVSGVITYNFVLAN